MAYPFPSIKTEVYPKTFLKDVRFGVLFEEISLDEALKGKLSEFFLEEFGLKDLEMEKMPKAALISSNDEKIRFAFGMGRAELSIKREAYRSFADASPLLGKIFAFLKVIGQDEVKKVMFSKYNELDFEAKDSTAMVDVMRSVFSKSLMKSMSQEDQTALAALSRWEKVLQYEGKDESDSLFTIEYGFKRQPKDVGRNSLTLKTLMESQRDGIQVPTIPDLLTEYNQILDNAFHWSVSDEVIRAMKKN